MQVVDVSWLTKANRRTGTDIDLNVAGIVCSNGKTYATPQPLSEIDLYSAGRGGRDRECAARHLHPAEDNERYPLAVLHLLRQNQENAMSATGLRLKVLNAMVVITDPAGNSKQHNSQMGISIALRQTRKIV